MKYSFSGLSSLMKDKEMVLKANDDKIVGFIGSDGNSYWFINYDYAIKNYEVSE